MRELLIGKEISQWAELGIEGLLDAALTQQGIDFSSSFKGIDTEAKSMMYSLLMAGTSVESLQNIFAKTQTVDRFKNALKAMNKEVLEGEGENGHTLADNIEKVQASFEALSKAKEALGSGAATSDIGLSDLMEKYPQLLG